VRSSIGTNEIDCDFPRLLRIASCDALAAERAYVRASVGRLRYDRQHRIVRKRRKPRPVCRPLSKSLVAGLVAAMGNRRDWRGIFLSVESVTC